MGTKGGILLLLDAHLVDLTDITTTMYCLSTMVQIRASDVSFKIATVYGPTLASLKDAFFAELVSQKPMAGVSWLVMGDLVIF